MSRRTCCFAVLLLCTSAAGQPQQRNPRKATEGLPAPRGTVTQISKEAIAIQVPGEPPMRFVPSETLASGMTPSKPRPRAFAPYTIGASFKYRLTDVHVGDSVDLIYAVVNGVEVCDHIRINKRPGGLVPPLPEDANDPGPILYHDYANAFWNLEDHGIPYPAHFAYRRFPIAPSPREVKR